MLYRKVIVSFLFTLSIVMTSGCGDGEPQRRSNGNQPPSEKLGDDNGNTNGNGSNNGGPQMPASLNCPAGEINATEIITSGNQATVTDHLFQGGQVTILTCFTSDYWLSECFDQVTISAQQAY